ncbi:hypothetical protein sync_1822 [Synechococcus sp. CC9311]|nr:hypothetical protein sync_1822 [Synechococcus sp. CC9311]
MQIPASQEITALEASARQSHSLLSRIQNGEIHESGQEQDNRRIGNKKNLKMGLFLC